MLVDLSLFQDVIFLVKGVEMIKIEAFFFTLSLLLISACAPVFYNYYYISFEGYPDIKVLHYGESKVSNLKHHEEMPIKYQLSKESYTVYLDLDLVTNGGPRLFIKAKKKNGSPLDIHGVVTSNIAPSKRCGLFDEPYPQDKVPVNELVKVYNWYLSRNGCSMSDDNTNRMVVSFEVINDNKVIGKEVLPFKIVHNGFYILNDAI